MKKIPTFGELLAAYHEIAAIERIKSERPCVRTVGNVLGGTRSLLRLLSDEKMPFERIVNEPHTWLDRRQMDIYFKRVRNKGLSNVTTWSYLFGLKGLTARWTLPYYDDLGWRIRPFQIPVCRKKTMRYRRPSREMLKKVKSWYEGLTIRSDRRLRTVATLMLEFAMRNGDVTRLSHDNFIERDGEWYLSYTPHKTELSSGRTICWPIHPDLLGELIPGAVCTHTAADHDGRAASMEPLESSNGRAVCPNRAANPQHPISEQPTFPIKDCRKIFATLNHELRELGFTGSKALYELRKICVDHIYQKYGAEMASSISGDDLRTVTRYYADPSAVKVHNLRVVDLL